MSDIPLMHRVFVKGMLWLPSGAALAVLRRLPITEVRWRYLRGQLLRRRSLQLQQLMRAIDFRSALMIEPSKEICVISEGISLSAELTNRYLKASAEQPGNEGVYLNQVLTKHGIELNQVIDVGANFGEISLFFSKTRPNARILAIEASPRNFEVLLQNRARQLFATDNITPVHCAVGNCDGEVDISVGLGAANSIITGNDNALRHEISATETVSMMTLSSLARQYRMTAPDLIKIDIEGAEPLLAESLADLRARALFIEFSNKNTQESYFQLAKRLLETGYSAMTKTEEVLPDFAAVREYLIGRWKADNWGTASRGCDLWFFLDNTATSDP